MRSVYITCMKAQNQIMARAKKLTMFRPSELPQVPGRQEQLRRLVSRGMLIRVSRGLYTLPNSDITEHFTATQACKRIPDGVICLISALAFHNFTTQLPHQVWMAVRRRSAVPKINDLPIRIVRVSDNAFSAGIQIFRVSGVALRVYSPARTVADCFKFRSAVGVDVAVEALREALRMKRCTRTEIDRFAKICRVSRVMRPYMEALIS
jgi:predicted transcriptional regulator of viral defense system